MVKSYQDKPLFTNNIGKKIQETKKDDLYIQQIAKFFSKAISALYANTAIALSSLRKRCKGAQYLTPLPKLLGN
uniref:Uncharacterized protein n=1 Tax=Tolypothrix bouteillei VB521301 TaxID=1479485 RepID=A0A0C1MWQ1_9CYAN